MSQSSDAHCPQCGAELPPAAQGAVCPRCALGAALAASNNEHDTQVLSLDDIPQPDQKLEATALVHDAWRRLSASGHQDWKSLGHFFAAAAEAMRRILVERARQKALPKRGGSLLRVDWEHADIAINADDELVLALDDALGRYAEKDPQGAELVKLRFFAGLPNQQAALLLGIPERTAKRTWAYARAWLFNDIQKNH